MTHLVVRGGGGGGGVRVHNFSVLKVTLPLGLLADQKEIKSFRSKSQDSRHGGRLENLIFASSLERKGQLT